MGNEPDPFAIPPSLLRDGNNKAEFMHMAEVEVVEESRPAKVVKAKTKANGAAPVKAADKATVKAAAKAPVKAKTAPKATAKPTKALDKAKSGKPKAEIAEKDLFGFRKGSAKSKAAAMYARKSGATLIEVKDVVGSVQLNVLNSLEADGYPVKREKEERKGQRPVTRYWLGIKK